MIFLKKIVWLRTMSSFSLFVYLFLCFLFLYFHFIHKVHFISLQKQVNMCLDYGVFFKSVYFILKFYNFTPKVIYIMYSLYRYFYDRFILHVFFLLDIFLNVYSRVFFCICVLVCLFVCWECHLNTKLLCIQNECYQTIICFQYFSLYLASYDLVFVHMLCKN